MSLSRELSQTDSHPNSGMANLLSRIAYGFPTIAKYLLCLLLLLNFRSFPLIWHWRLFWPVTLFHTRYRLFRLRLLFKPHDVKQKLDAQWWDSLTHPGANPFDVVVKYTNWAGVDDSDFNIHLSNSSYAKAMDCARVKAGFHWLPLFFGNGGWTPLAATHYHFIREIPMFANYEIRVRIGAWDKKWVYVICRYVTKPKKGTGSTNKSTTTAASFSKPRSDIAPISANSLRTETNTSESPSPIPYNSNYPPPNASIIDTLLRKQEHLEEPDGAVLHATSVARLCCKYGRITVPPALVFALNGFSVVPRHPPPSDSVNLPSPSSPPNNGLASTVSYSKTNPPPHWPIVQSLVFPAYGGSVKKLQAFLKGGWKDVPAKERWWETCMGGEIEEKREERLGVLEGIRAGMQGVRDIL